MFPDLKPARERTDQPTWEVATLFPTQGNWTEAEYLALETNRLIEFDDGYLEFLERPTPMHQRILALLYRLLYAWVTQRDAGELFLHPFPFMFSHVAIVNPI